MVVTDLLLESFDDIFDVKYTARMEEELDEIEDGKLDWRVAMDEFYTRFDKDLKHAETHMTDIKRMEKPTDLTCEKCSRPLVIKWGKHGSFIACTGYPDFSSKNIESDLEKVQKDIEVRRQRALKNIEIKRSKLQAKYPQVTIAWGEDGEFIVTPRPPRIKTLETALRKLEKEITAKRLEDRGKIELRLERLQARYPQMKGFYDLDLRDTGEGVALTVRRKEEFCTYTRELTVDLPDLEGADLSDQGEEETCENCGRPMVLKKGRFGTFFACSEYPDCKTTKQIGGTQTKDVPLDEKCPQCDSNLVMKYGRFGEFTACSNYPTCKYVKQKTIGVKCPECSEGEIIERRSRKGKTFYGCNRYPDCTFVAWGKPVPEKCPECGSPYMIEKFVKAGAFWQCPNADCKHKVEVPVVVAS
jgi:DNA topoisomerase-1